MKLKNIILEKVPLGNIGFYIEVTFMDKMMGLYIHVDVVFIYRLIFEVGFGFIDGLIFIYRR